MKKKLLPIIFIFLFIIGAITSSIACNAIARRTVINAGFYTDINRLFEVNEPLRCTLRDNSTKSLYSYLDNDKSLYNYLKSLKWDSLSKHPNYINISTNNSDSITVYGGNVNLWLYDDVEYCQVGWQDDSGFGYSYKKYFFEIKNFDNLWNLVFPKSGTAGVIV